MKAIKTLRTRLLQVEQHIKEIGGDLERSVWQLQELSKAEAKALRRLLEQRQSLLNDMMQPTAAEVQRLERQNERLQQLYRELCAHVKWAGSSYPAEGTLFYEYDPFADEPSVLPLSKDAELLHPRHTSHGEVLERNHIDLLPVKSNAYENHSIIP